MIFRMLIFVVVTGFALPQDITLTYENYDPANGTVEIWIDSVEELLGVQLQITGFHVTSAENGDAIHGFAFFSTNSSGLLLLFGGLYGIYSGYNQLCTVNFDAVYSSSSSIVNPYFSNASYEEVTDIDYSDTIDTGFCQIAGDSNNDSVLDVIDIILTVFSILDSEACNCSDLNSDSETDVSDIVAMVSTIMRE